MKFRNLLATALVVLGMSCEKPQETRRATNATKPKRPNIVFILADDMGFSDLGCYGSEIPTPHIDSLARQGLRFTRFYNTAKCSPSRATYLSGYYAQQVGMNGYPDTLRNCLWSSRLLQRAGYRTLMVGKHHGEQNPIDHGFDRYYGLRDGICNHFNPGQRRPGEPKPAHKSSHYPRHWCIDSQQVAPYTPPTDFYSTKTFTDTALSYLRQYRGENKPFYLYLAYTAPHAPLQAYTHDLKKMAGRYDQGYQAIRRARYRKQRKMGLVDGSFPLSQPSFTPWDSLSDSLQKVEARTMEAYAAMIHSIDRHVGRLVNYLKKTGQLSNTLLCFTSDNGASPADNETADWLITNPDTAKIGSMERWTYQGPSWANVSNTPYRYYKTWSYNGGTCAPFVAFWPGKIRPGHITDEPAHLIDLMPTFLSLAEQSYPAAHQGQNLDPLPGENLEPLLTTGQAPERDYLYWRFKGGRALMQGPYKLVKGQKKPHTWHQSDTGGSWQLFNLRQDKTETRNLASQKPALVRQMAAIHDSLQQSFWAWKKAGSSAN